MTLKRAEGVLRRVIKSFSRIFPFLFSLSDLSHVKKLSSPSPFFNTHGSTRIYSALIHALPFLDFHLVYFSLALRSNPKEKITKAKPLVEKNVVWKADQRIRIILFGKAYGMTRLTGEEERILA